MKTQDLGSRLPRALGAAALALAVLSPSLATTYEPPPPIHYAGLLNDYTPSAAVVKGGPYEMRGRWSLDVDLRHNSARFTAAMNMETSDYGIDQGTVNKDDPTTRGQHTHHISVLDGVVGEDWSTACPAFNPAVKRGFVVRGTAFITGNGSPAPFGNPSPVTICVLGGDNLEFSNLTLVLGAPASGHFGKQAIHGVVTNCNGPFALSSPACTVQE